MHLPRQREIIAITAKPEILTPRQPSRALSDQNLDLLSHLLDDFIRIPGTPIRFGLDGIVGLIPGVGDLLGGLASSILILAAFLRGVPKVTVARMVLNVAIETSVGSLPLVGDLFDIWFRANRRNYALMSESLAHPHQRNWTDWLFVAAILLLLAALILLPLLLFAWFGAQIFSHLSAWIRGATA